MQEAKSQNQDFKSYLHLQEALKSFQNKYRDKKIEEVTQMYEELMDHPESPDLIAKRLSLMRQERFDSRVKLAFKLPKHAKEELIKLMFAYCFNPEAQIYLSTNFLFLQDLHKLVNKRKNLQIELDWRPVYSWHQNVFYDKRAFLFSLPKLLMLKVLDMHIVFCQGMKKFPRKETTHEVWNTFKSMMVPGTRELWKGLAYLYLFLPNNKHASNDDVQLWFDPLMKLWKYTPGRYNMNTYFVSIFRGVAKSHPEIDWLPHLAFLFETCYAGVVPTNKPKDERSSPQNSVEEVVLTHAGNQSNTFGSLFAYILESSQKSESWKLLEKLIASTKIYMQEDLMKNIANRANSKAFIQLFWGLAEGFRQRLRYVNTGSSKVKPVSSEMQIRFQKLLFPQIFKVVMVLGTEELAIIKRLAVIEPRYVIIEQLMPLLEIEFENINAAQFSAINVARNFSAALMYERFPERFQTVRFLMEHLVQQSASPHSRTLFVVCAVFARFLLFVPIVEQGFWEREFHNSALASQHSSYDVYLQFLRLNNFDEFQFFQLQERLPEMIKTIFQNLLKFLNSAEEASDQDKGKMTLLGFPARNKEEQDLQIHMLGFIRQIFINCTQPVLEELFEIFVDFVKKETALNAKHQIFNIASYFAEQLSPSTLKPFIDFLFSKLMKGDQIRDLSSQSLTWWGILLNGLLSSYTDFNQEFVTQKLAPYVKALFLSEQKSKIEEGVSLLGNCIRNQESTPHFLQEQKFTSLIESVKCEGNLIKNFYASIGQYDPSNFKINYSPICKEASMLLLELCEQVLDATLKSFKENEKDSNKFVRVLSAIQVYFQSGRLRTTDQFDAADQKQFWKNVYLILNDGNKSKASEMEEEVKRIRKKFIEELIIMLELIVELGESSKINQEVIKTASATVKSYLNGGIKNTLIPKFHYTSSSRWAIDYKVNNKRGRRFYSHFFKKVEDHSFKIMNYVKSTTKITEEDKKISKLIYRLAHHPFGSTQMPVSVQIRKRSNSIPFFIQLLTEVISRLEKALNSLKDIPTSDIHESEVKKCQILLEQMTDILQRAPVAFRGEGLVFRYLSALLQVPEIQNKVIQISVMTSFFAFISVFQLGYPPKERLECASKNTVIEEIEQRIHVNPVRTTQQESKHYQGYVEILKILNQKKSKHWAMEAIKITLSHFLLKFMKPVDWQEIEDGFLHTFETSPLSSMKTLLARGVYKLASFRAEMHGEKIVFCKEPEQVEFNRDTRFLVSKEGEFLDLKSSGWVCSPTIFSKQPSQSCYSRFSKEVSYSQQPYALKLFSDYERFKSLITNLGEDLKTQEESQQVGGEENMLSKLQAMYSTQQNMNITLALGLLTEYQSRQNPSEVLKPLTFFQFMYSLFKFYSKALIEPALHNAHKLISERKEDLPELTYRILGALVNASIRALKYVEGDTVGIQKQQAQLFLKCFASASNKAYESISMQFYRAVFNRDLKRMPILLETVMKSPFQLTSQSLMEKQFQLWNDLLVTWKFRAMPFLERLIDSLPPTVLCSFPMLHDDMIAFIASLRLCLDHALTRIDSGCIESHPVLTKFEDYFAKQATVAVQDLKQTEAEQFQKNVMQLVRQIYPIRNIPRIAIKSAPTYLKFAIELVGHKDDKVSKEGLNTSYSLILTRFPQSTIDELESVLRLYDKNDPLWRRREHALQCQMVLLASNCFRRNISLEPIVSSCFAEKTHKAKITKAHVLSVAVELAQFDEVNALIQNSIETLKGLKKKEDFEKIFDNVNILVGLAYSQMSQIYEYTPGLLTTLAKYGEGYDEASDIIRKLFASFWQRNQKRWAIIAHHFTEEQQQAIRGLSNPFHYFS